MLWEGLYLHLCIFALLLLNLLLCFFQIAEFVRKYMHARSHAHAHARTHARNCAYF
eukprot:JP437416.1.p1 GENE.JP437416.1~~JP437416.1.p1  ORF type:complete len:56 (+),score=4.23 JP437416.1:121-288(+)